jgi:hypothetical protein
MTQLEDPKVEITTLLYVKYLMIRQKLPDHEHNIMLLESFKGDNFCVRKYFEDLNNEKM